MKKRLPRLAAGAFQRIKNFRMTEKYLFQAGGMQGSIGYQCSLLPYLRPLLTYRQDCTLLFCGAFCYNLFNM